MRSAAAEIALPERYRVTGRIAGGGMASVWEAEDLLLGRRVAVKVIAAHLTEDARIAERFRREACLAASLSSHPHVVTVFDIGEHEGRSFIVMERLTGGSVADAMRRRHGYIPRHQTIRWLREAGEALDTAHRQRIVHRDVKPGNLLLDERLHVKIADFGIARLAGSPTLTATGDVFGTAAYLSPEQAQGEAATPASDRYSLAVVAYELLTGRRPFDAEHFAAQARQHIEEQPPAPSTRVPGELPSAVDGVLLRGLAKDPKDRWPSAGSMVEALDRALEGVAPSDAESTQILRAPPEPPEPPGEELHIRRTVAPVSHRPTRRAPRSRLLVAALMAIAAIAVAGVILASRGGSDGSSTAQGTRAATGPAPATTPKPSQPKAQTTPAAPAAPKTTPAAPATPNTTPAPAPAPASGSPATLNAQGFALLNAGRPGDAVAPLEGAVRACGSSTALDPCGYAIYNLGHALRLAGRPADAVPLLERRLSFPGQHDLVARELATARAEASGRAAQGGRSDKKAGKDKGGDEGD